MHDSDPRRATRPQPTRRALAKQRTRDNILAAGRRLFDALGYDAATLRDVAKAAHVSTGAVFGNFANKAALFVGVINQDCEALCQRLDASKAANGGAVEAVARLLTIAQDHHAAALGLIRSAVGFVWRRDVDAELADLTGPEQVCERLAAILRRGVETGELCLPADASVVSRQLLSGYLATYAPLGLGAVSDEDRRAAQIAQARALLAGYVATCPSRSKAA